MLHRRRTGWMERVVRDVVDNPDDPARLAVPRTAEVEDVDARGRLLEVAEVGAPAGQRVRDQDPVDAAMEDRERRLPLLGDQPVERRSEERRVGKECRSRW